ncbi:MAG: tetratricopeptide repeat protein [Anaerolineae bacterium]|jgi:tetratricopeptide (TPR) repeat protein|nr:tetratricopeptide repeat protein [Anaerolineae bacterium]
MFKRLVPWLALALLLLTLALFNAAPITRAIGEVTPTPAPAQPAATAAPAQPLQPPAIPATPLPDVEVLIGRAIDAIQSGDFQAAIDLMDEAIAEQPEYAESYLVRGAAYSQLENYDRAIADFTTAIELLPYEANLYLFRGNAYVALGDNAAALADYSRAIELNPRYEQAFSNRSFLSEQLGDDDASAVDRLIAEGLSRTGREDYRGAIQSFSEAINRAGAATGNTANAYYNRGLASFLFSDLEGAIEDYTAALEINPDMHDSYLGRGIAYRQTGDVRRAGSDFLRRIEILEERTQSLNLTADESVTVMMTYGQVYRASFSGLGGSSITLAVRATDNSGVDPLIAIVDPSGVVIAGDDDFGEGISNLDALVDNLRLPADGTYTLVISHANGGFTGELEITLTND